uniref:PEHE domain-containing protein n=2 Tax=Timema TaxID=61471 RepID=A0A7R9FLB4_9NEOP|nr:unnamed protein product [Timema tahoe]
MENFSLRGKPLPSLYSNPSREWQLPTMPLGHSVEPVCKRAAWRWGQDRAGVASRWTWLQAQISDLEYRIRQHTDLHRQIRATKGPVSLGEASGVASSPGRVVVNGFHGPVKESSGSGRTRPLMRSAFRKRRLLPTDGLHRTSKKAARPSSVRCGCRPGPLGSSCPLCTGRSDPMEGQQPDTLTAGERVALLDPTFHPVLSFRDDIPSGLHYDAVMRMAEWQQRTLRTLRAAKVVDKDRGLQDRRTKAQHQHTQQHVRRKYIRRKPLASSTLTAKIKRKLSVRGRKPKNHHQDVGNLSLHRMRQRRRQSSRGPATPNTIVTMTAIVPALTVAGADEEAEGEESMAGSKNPSPIPSPLGFSLGKDLLSYRRKRENSYDIDNIVIPYSIAAATRVEKLPYKEIPTPKWRVAELNTKLDLKNNGMVRHSSEDSDVEDLNEDTIVARHERCEVDEKKKFMSYLKFPHSGRSRAHRRTDSMAESSGANTPDPMSPQSIIDPSTSPMASPPATPLSILVEGDGPVTRRPRTASVSLVLRPSTPTQPEHYIEVTPYETRTYPLPEGMYETLLSQMPEGHPFPPCPATPKKHLTKDNYDSDHSTPASPSSDSTESALGEGEDPNDPEWTVFSNVKR